MYLCIYVSMYLCIYASMLLCSWAIWAIWECFSAHFGLKNQSILGSQGLWGTLPRLCWLPWAPMSFRVTKTKVRGSLLAHPKSSKNRRKVGEKNALIAWLIFYWLFAWFFVDFKQILGGKMHRQRGFKSNQIMKWLFNRLLTSLNWIGNTVPQSSKINKKPLVV